MHLSGKLISGGVLLLVVVACSTSAPTSEQAAGTAVTSRVVAEGGHGTGCDDLVIIKGARNEDEGVKAEYAWISKTYPGYSKGGQNLGSCSGKAIDVIRIITASGEERSIYFDISGFLGKW